MGIEGGNPARRESLQEAVELDRKLHAIWTIKLSNVQIVYSWFALVTQRIEGLCKRIHLSARFRLLRHWFAAV